MSLDRKILSHLIDPASIERVSDMGVRPEIFEEPIAGNVFAFILEYWRSSQMSKAPTAYVLEQQFPGFRVEPADTEEDAGWLAEAMMKRYATNNVQQMCMAAATTANTDPLGTLKMLTAATYEASQTIAPRHSRSDMFNIDERRLRYQKATEGTGRGITLGLSELDDHTNGLLPGELCAVGAFSKVGKTMFLVNAAAKARYAGYQPILFSLEMPIAEIEDRMDAMLSGVSYSKLTHHKLHLADLEKLHATQDLVREMGPIRIESPEEGERTVSHLCARARHTGSDLLIIDQLSFM
jgi:replicative DNA helicase